MFFLVVCMTTYHLVLLINLLQKGTLSWEGYGWCLACCYWECSCFACVCMFLLLKFLWIWTMLHLSSSDPNRTLGASPNTEAKEYTKASLCNTLVMVQTPAPAGSIISLHLYTEMGKVLSWAHGANPSTLHSWPSHGVKTTVLEHASPPWTSKLETEKHTCWTIQVSWHG